MVFDIEGVLAPVFTPTEEDTEINVSIIPEYLQYLVDRGIKGILVGGTTGEYVTLSLEERKTVLLAWLDAAKLQGVKVIAQVGGVPLPDVLEMARFAETHHADAIMTLPELYYKPKTVDQLVFYLEMVSSAAPTLPLLYYHFPMMSGVDTNIPELFTKACDKIPNFKGLKADLGIAVQITDLLGRDQRVFIANHLISPAVLLGHESSIATVSNMVPRLVREIVECARNDDVAKVRKYQGALNMVVSGITQNGDFLPTMKMAMSMMTGLNVGPPRRPMMKLDDKQMNNIAKSLATMKIVEDF